MPKFILNKLVRDKLRKEYERMGQKANYRTLSTSEHATELKRKIIEEVKEIPDGVTTDQTVSEIADIQQAINDLKELKGVSDEQVEATRTTKFDKKGGFSGATFVESLELKDSDEWIEYYRKEPNIYIEIDKIQSDELVIPKLDLGIYEHYKGNRYEVVGVGADTETQKPTVIYKPLYDSEVKYWVRPYDMFIGTVKINDKEVLRFKKID